MSEAPVDGRRRLSAAAREAAGAAATREERGTAVLVPLLTVLTVIIAFGIWRRLGPIQWIWLLFGAAMVLVIIWLVMLAFVIGPEMRRRAPQTQHRGMPVGVVVPAAGADAAAAGAAGRPAVLATASLSARRGSDGLRRPS